MSTQEYNLANEQKALKVRYRSYKKKFPAAYKRMVGRDEKVLEVLKGQGFDAAMKLREELKK